MTAILGRAWRVWRTNPAVFYRRLAMLLRAPIRNFRALLTTAQRQDRVNRSYAAWLACSAGASPTVSSGPLLSVLMPVFNTPPDLLEQAINSVMVQTYPHWELCAVDDASTEPHVQAVLEAWAQRDPRIHHSFRPEQGHISRASNDALEMASGDFVVLLDHDDLITPDALAQVADVVRSHPEVDLVYSDEDKLEPDGSRVEPFFKPAWSPTLLASCNYITHLAALRRSIVCEVAGFRDDVVGSQDHDLFLRVGERSRAVAHVPRVLYSWRKSPTSTAAASTAKPYAIDAARRALESTLERREIEAAVEPSHLNGIFLVRQKLPLPLRVSFVIMGGPADFELAASGLEVCSVIHGAERDAASVKRQIDDVSGDYLVWLDGAARPLRPDSLLALLEHLADPSVAITGGTTRHRRSDEVLQAGIVVGDAGQPVYAYRGLPEIPQRSFYLNLKDLPRDVSATWVGCSAMRGETWRELGGWRPDLPASLAMVDLGLRAVQTGFRNVYTPLAAFGARRDLPPLPDVSQLRWDWKEYQDPYWNPNMTAGSGDGLPFRCQAGAAPRVLAARQAQMAARAR